MGVRSPPWLRWLNGTHELVEGLLEVVGAVRGALCAARRSGASGFEAGGQAGTRP